MKMPALACVIKGDPCSDSPVQIAEHFLSKSISHETNLLHHPISRKSVTEFGVVFIITRPGCCSPSSHPVA